MTDGERIAELEAEVLRQKREVQELNAQLEAEKKKGGIGLAFLAGKRRMVPF